jgi:RNA polymerase sigma-70 factor (ECF subfamily)
MTNTPPTDEEIAVRIQGGDHESIGFLIERYEKKLLRYGHKFLSAREDIEDIVQDVFVSAYQNIQSFDPSQTFSPWIYRIAHNALVNALRKSTRRPFLPFDFDALVAHVVYEDPAESERERRDMQAMIDVGLDTISPKYKEILILYYLEDLSYKEIADVLHVPQGTVGIRLSRARSQLIEACKKLESPHI